MKSGEDEPRARRRLARHRRGIAPIALAVIVVAVAVVVVVGGLFAAGIFDLRAGPAGATPSSNLTVSPTSGPINTSVSLNATGLSPNTSYSVYLSVLPGAIGYFLTTFTTNGAGTTQSSSETFAVASPVPAGTYYVDVVSDSTGMLARYAPIQFTVTLPMVSIFPTHGPAGSPEVVYATGLAPNEVYFVDLDPTPGVVGYALTSLLSDKNGTLSLPAGQTVNVPDSVPVGTYSVDVFRNAVGPNPLSTYIVHAASPFTVTGSVMIGPTQGPEGTQVTLTVSGLLPNQMCQVYWDLQRGALTQVISNLKTDRDGNYSGTFTVPQNFRYVPYYVDVQPVNGGPITTASSQFTVTKTSVTFSPTSGPGKTLVSIIVPNLVPNTAYTVAFDTVPGAIDFVVTNLTTASGTFYGTFNVPPNVLAGTYSVDIFQVANSIYTAAAMSQFTVTTANVTISPTMGPGNTSVLISATGLAPTMTYNAFFGSLLGESGIFLTNFTTAANGGYTGRFTIPFDILGQATNYLNVFQGSYGKNSYGTYIVSASSQFTVTAIPSFVLTSPASGPAGTLVTLNATGLAATTPYNIDFYQTQNQVFISYVVSTFISDANGNYNGTFRVPTYVNIGAVAPPGAYYVAVLEQNSYWVLPLEDSTFTVTASLSSAAEQYAVITPTLGPVGTSVSLSGVGLQPSTAYRASLNLTTLPGVQGYFLKNFTTTASGSFNGSFTVPRNVPAGTYYVNLYQVATGIYNLSAQKQFTVTPIVTISSIYGFFGPGNSSEVISETGLMPKTQYTVYFDQVEGSADYFATSFTTPPGGNYSGFFTVPCNAPMAAYYVDVFGTAVGYVVSGSNLPDLFAVTTPSLTISPTSGPFNTSVSILATGLAPKAAYTLDLDPNPVAVDFLVQDFATDVNGSFNRTFNVPSGVPGGTYSVDLFKVASSTYIASASSPFGVTPAITVSPIQGPLGAIVTVSGTGFSVSTTLTSLVFDSVTISSCSAGSLTVSVMGSFSCTFKVPSATSGTVVTATDVSGQMATTRFTVT